MDRGVQWVPCLFQSWGHLDSFGHFFLLQGALSLVVVVVVVVELAAASVEVTWVY